MSELTEEEKAFDYSDEIHEDSVDDANDEEFSETPDNNDADTHADDDISDDYTYTDEDDDDDEDEEHDDADGNSSDDGSGTDDDSSDDNGEPKEIDQALIFEAAGAGLSLEDVSEIKDPAALRAAIKFAKKNKPAGDGQEGEEGSEDEDEFSFEEFNLEVPDDFDEEGAEIMQGMNKHFNAQMKTMTEQMNAQAKVIKESGNASTQAMEQRAQDEFYKSFDKQCMAKKEWQEVLGKGEIESLSKDSKESDNRIAVVREMEAQVRAHPELINDQDKLFERALLLTFPEQKTKIDAETKGSRKRDHQGRRGTQRPSGKKNRSVGDLPSKKKTVNMVTALINKALGNG